MAAALAAGQSDRLLRPDRAAIRIESRRNADAGGEEGQQVHLERRKDVDYQRVDRGRGGGVGESGGRQSPRISCRKRDARIQGLGRAREVVVTSFRDVRIVVWRLRNSGRKSAAWRFRLEGPAELPEPGALWNRMGRAGRGD